jgi:hypothetical protein
VDYNKLTLFNYETLSLDGRAMKEFLIMAEYRRSRMSVYMNGEEHNTTCMLLGGVLCDNGYGQYVNLKLGKRQ